MILDCMPNEIESKSIPTAFHTFTDCGSFYTIYGGIRRKNMLSGDLIFLENKEKKLIHISYKNNTNSINK